MLEYPVLQLPPQPLYTPPACTGQVIMESSSCIAKAPDGNGGVYTSLKASGVLDKLTAEGG